MSAVRTGTVLTCIALIVFAPIVRAQMAEPPAKAELIGVLLDVEGRPLGDHEVTLATSTDEVVASTRTNQYGRFGFADVDRAQLVSGEYALRHNRKRVDIPLQARSGDGLLVLVSAEGRPLMISMLVTSEAGLARATKLRDAASPAKIDHEIINKYEANRKGNEVSQQLVDWARAGDEKAMGAILEDDDRIGVWWWVGGGILVAGATVGVLAIIDKNSPGIDIFFRDRSSTPP